MIRVLGLTIFLVVAMSFAIHAGVKFPWWVEEWFGKLPGDMIITKGKLTVYFPVTSSLLVSSVISFFLSLFSKE